MFGVGVPLAAQSSVRVSPSLMVLLEGRDLVNLGGTMTTRVWENDYTLTTIQTLPPPKKKQKNKQTNKNS